MDVETFWNLIESSNGDGKKLATLLKELKAEEIRGFGDILDLQFNKAFNWNLWAAAYLINGGCSEEEFGQFIYWLVGLGEEKFKKSVEDPDVLAEIVQDDDSTFNEGIIVAIARTLDRLDFSIDGKSNATVPADLMEYNRRPKKPRGKTWKEDEELLEMFPALGERFEKNIEGDDEEDEDWDENEDKDKSKLRRAWDKFIEFFARIFDKFIKFFSKKKKGEEEEDKEKEEKDKNRISTKIGVNFWLYIGFIVLFFVFLAFIPLTVYIQGLIRDKITLIQSFLNSDPDSVLNFVINRSIDHHNIRIGKWSDLQILWVLFMVISLIGGLPFIKVILQPRFIQLTPDSIEFLNKKEKLLQTLKIKDIEMVQMSRNKTMHFIPKKNIETKPILMIDMDSSVSLKKFCLEHKITSDEDSNLGKMLYYYVSPVINKLLKRS